MSKTGRNEPCPCGNGRKYKLCHGAPAANESIDDGPQAAVQRALMWLRERHRKAFAAAIEDQLDAVWPDADEADEADGEAGEPPLLEPEDFAIVQGQVMERLLADGELQLRGGEFVNIAELLLGDSGPGFNEGQRQWLQAMTTAPLRLYTVTDVQPGEGMTLVDTLDTAAPPLRVQERRGSHATRLGMLLGLRVVPWQDQLLLSGVTYPFGRGWENQVISDVRRAEALGNEVADDCRLLVADAVLTAWIRQQLYEPPLPRLVEAQSGQPLLFITDHYTVQDGLALQALLGAHPELNADDEQTWSRLQRGDDGADRPLLTISLKRDANRVQVFYRTEQRAEVGRPWFEALAAASVQHLTREVSDPLSSMQSGEPQQDQLHDAPPASSKAREVPGVTPETMHEMMKETLHRFYARWADEPIPALGALTTPRQAIKTPAGEERVRGLLRQYEEGELRMAREQKRQPVSYDFLWQQIGLQR